MSAHLLLCLQVVFPVRSFAENNLTGGQRFQSGFLELRDPNFPRSTSVLQFSMLSLLPPGSFKSGTPRSTGRLHDLGAVMCGWRECSSTLLHIFEIELFFKKEHSSNYETWHIK